jgi:transmembrane sensor
MKDQSLLLLIRFVSDNDLTIHELELLRDWMIIPENRELVDEWMHMIWDKAPEKELNLTFEQLTNQISEQYDRKKSGNFGFRKAVTLFQRAAAILIFPIIIFFFYYTWIREPVPSNVYTETIVPLGQKSEIVLPDSTHVWLNSASRLRYPVGFGSAIREVFLDGEAYFEVTRDKHHPFLVQTSSLAVEVLGTKFNVKAYPDEMEVKTALLEGKVNLQVALEAGKGDVETLEMKPGEMIEYSRTDHSVLRTGFKADEVIGWRSNRLIFRDDTFDKLVKKIERWYNVKIIYDKSLFSNQRLTVELLEGESLDRLFQIIEKAIHVNYRIDKQNIWISPK